jgi:hypothetical protein
VRLAASPIKHNSYVVYSSFVTVYCRLGWKFGLATVTLASSPLPVHMCLQSRAFPMTHTLTPYTPPPSHTPSHFTPARYLTPVQPPDLYPPIICPTAPRPSTGIFTGSSGHVRPAQPQPKPGASPDMACPQPKPTKEFLS